MEVVLRDPNEIIADANFHLNTILTDCERIRLDGNMDTGLTYKINNIKERIQLTKQLLIVGNTNTFIELANQVNLMFTVDSELSSIHIIIKNYKRNVNNSNIAKLNLDYGINR